MPRQPIFFYDLGSPYAWLTAERIGDAFDAEVEWVPVLLGGIFKATGRGSWAQTAARAEGMAEVERRAAAIGLPPLQWADPWPNNGLHAMRVAAHANSRPFDRAAFRIQFAEGLALSEPDNVALAAERAGVEHAEDKATLRANTDRALELGVIGVPTISVGDELFWGDDRLDDAVAASARQQ
jgi:2-hydroxychromene-2-carboxylate isomerase